MGNGDASWGDDREAGEESAVLFPQNEEVAQQERQTTSDQPAEESQSPSPAIGSRVLDEVIKILKKDSEEETDGNRDQGIDFDVDDELLAFAFLPEINFKIDKGQDDAYSDHQGIHIDETQSREHEIIIRQEERNCPKNKGDCGNEAEQKITQT